MKKILLLAAIYSLVINQCAKESRKVSKSMRESTRPDPRPYFLRSQQSREFANNDEFGFKRVTKIDTTSLVLGAHWLIIK